MSGLLLAQIEVSARAVEMRLRLGALVARRSLPALLSAITPCTKRPLPRPAVERALEASERLVAWLRVVPDTCLYRALARYALLRRAGHPARFMMGLDPRAREIEGHAWVELHGAPVGEEIDPGMAVTFAYPGLSA